MVFSYLVFKIYIFILRLKTEAGHLEIQFKGFSGSFAGDEGKPGVEFHPELGVYKANVSSLKFNVIILFSCC